MKKKIIILTGNELRHIFFSKILSNDPRINVLKVFCEEPTKNLEYQNQLITIPNTYLDYHIKARKQNEIDYFYNVNNYLDHKCIVSVIDKGLINQKIIVNEIIDINPDLIICYGSSIINSILLEEFHKKFINIHLGLSPYYRGTGTNVWPLINDELDKIGVTFMHIDKGIDTGEVFHQIRSKILIGDNPHSIGNRLIVEMSTEIIKIIVNFDKLVPQKQLNDKGKLYFNKHFDENACKKLYVNLSNGIVKNYLKKLNLDKITPCKIIENEVISTP